MATIHRFPHATGEDAQVWIVHFGSKSTPMIAQLCREIGLKSRIIPLERLGYAWLGSPIPQLLILSGGGSSVYDEDAPRINEDLYREIRRSQTTLLGICYGAQLLAKLEGGEVRRADLPEYSTVPLTCRKPFGGYRGGMAVMNHGDEIIRLPPEWGVNGSTDRCENAFVGRGNIWAVQFHPEMDHTDDGEQLLKHLAFNIAGCRQDYAFEPEAFVQEVVPWATDALGDAMPICGLSGGVDSAVAFTLGRKLLGNGLLGIFVDNGWMREHETDEVRGVFGEDRISYVDASHRFYDAIEAVPWNASDASAEQEGKYYEAIRKTMGKTFIDVFLAETHRSVPGVSRIALVQGTNVSDIIESETGLKAHHNVGGLPEQLGADIVEPLAWLYKFEIRELAMHLGLPNEVAFRQPFPGPGNAIRNWGRLTRENAKPLARANRILEEVMQKHYPPERRPCQYYAALLKAPRVGLMGDRRVMGYMWVVRMVTARRRESYTTLGVFRPSQAFQDELSHRLVTETSMPDGTPFVSVLYEWTGKPPSTTEPK